MKTKYVTAEIAMQLMLTGDVIQTSGFNYTPGSISYNADGSEGNRTDLW